MSKKPARIVYADLDALTRPIPKLARAARERAEGNLPPPQITRVAAMARTDLLDLVRDFGKERKYTDIPPHKWRRAWLSAAYTAYVLEYVRLSGWPRPFAPGISKPSRRLVRVNLRADIELMLRPIEDAWKAATRGKCGTLIDEVAQWFAELHREARLSRLRWYAAETPA